MLHTNGVKKDFIYIINNTDHQ